jgi:hypothetical protein
MRHPEWKAGAEELVRARRAFDVAAASLDGASLAEAAGRLVALGAGATVVAWAAEHAARARAAAAAVAGADLAELEDAAVALRALLDRRAEGSASLGDLERGVGEALGARDRVELAMFGAAALAGQPWRAGDEQESALLVFESLVRPELWRLTEVNATRRAALAWMAPEHRASFWWWAEGADIAPEALASMPSVAHLSARFPAAAAALRALVGAQHAWDAASSAPAPTEVASFGAWVARRTAGTRPHALPLAAAAAAEEVTLLDQPDFQVSWSPPGALVVDFVADRAPGATPSLRLAGGEEIPSEAVAGAEERFQITAGAPILAEDRVVLVLPLASGTIEIPLPSER